MYLYNLHRFFEQMQKSTRRLELAGCRVGWVKEEGWEKVLELPEGAKVENCSQVDEAGMTTVRYHVWLPNGLTFVYWYKTDLVWRDDGRIAIETTR